MVSAARRERLAFHFTHRLALKAGRYSVFRSWEGGFARPCLLPGWTLEHCRRCGLCPPRPGLTDEVWGSRDVHSVECRPAPLRAETDTLVTVCQAERPLHSLVGPSAGSGPRGGAPWGAGAPCHPANAFKGALWAPIWWICGRSLRRFLHSLPLGLTLHPKGFGIQTGPRNGSGSHESSPKAGLCLGSPQFLTPKGIM